MEVFINECSLHEQFAEHDDFDVALREFFSILNALLSKNIEYQLYQRSDILHVYKVVRDKKLITSLNTLRDKHFGTAVRNVLFNKLNARDWIQEQIHSSDDVFTYNDEIVTNTCMAELAERVENKMIDVGLLINFPESKFHDLISVIVIKNDEISTELDCVDNKLTFAAWLETNFQISRFEYDLNSRIPPLDSQTILRDKKRFERTNLPRQGGRVLYREKSTGCIWYADNLHFGMAAHIEVFDSTGFHLGEADLSGNLDYSKRDSNKKISL